MSGHVLFEENYGSTSTGREYLSSERGNVLIKEKKSESFESAGNVFRSVFLPQGYPESVSEDYLPYQIFDTIQAFASSITGTLATQAILQGVGVGNENATALAATITWILKDGTGMLGRILFAWIRGSDLDCDAKRWRLFADILNDFALCLEISAPYFPLWFTMIVCVAGVCKSIVGVAGGATRAALTLHQARRNNMADVSAKDGSQETLVNLAALICSLMIIPVISEHHSLIWTLFALSTSIHMWANYSAVKSVIMESLNLARFHILVQNYFNRSDLGLLTIKEVNFMEPVVFKTSWLFDINMGSQLKLLTSSLDRLVQYKELYRSEKYILGVNLQTHGVHISLHQAAEPRDELHAAFQAEIINFLANEYKDKKESINRALISDNALNEILCSSFQTAYNDKDEFEICRVSLELARNLFPLFYTELQRTGWLTGHVLFGTDEWRCTWGTSPKDE